ncbi:MAG: hypothetical protein SGPRY_009617 [Prymnesium sp.]
MITIDYGPFGFMDSYSADYTPNGSDDTGRYSCKEQPEVCAWNLQRLAESLAPLAGEGPTAEAVSGFWPAYTKHWLALFRKKLGLAIPEPGDVKLIEKLLSCMQATGSDFTSTFRLLARVEVPDDESECSKEALRGSEVVGQLVRCCLRPHQMAKRARMRFQDSHTLSQLSYISKAMPHLLHGYGLDAVMLEQEAEKMKRVEALRAMTDEEKVAADGTRWCEWLSLYSRRLLRERSAHGDLWQVRRHRDACLLKDTACHTLSSSWQLLHGTSSNLHVDSLSVSHSLLFT